MVEQLTLYRAPTAVADVDEIVDWLTDRIDAVVDVRDRFLERFAADDLAEAFASARVL